MRIVFVFFCCVFSSKIFAQKNNIISIHHLWNEKKLVLNEKYFIQKNDTISIQTLKYYISTIQLLKNNKIVWSEKNSFHLIDEEIENSKKINLSKMPSNIDYDTIQINLGIDSATNYAGVQGGDLDPTKGMYWTWQNGYINFKIEGISTASTTRNHTFQFHIGGYENGFATEQKVKINASKNKLFEIKIDIEKLLSKIDLSTQNEIMQPCKEAVEIANKLPLLFEIQ